MYYANKSESSGKVFIIKKTMGELSEHFQKNLEVFGGDPDAEYVIYRGKPSNKTFLGYYTLTMECSGKRKTYIPSKLYWVASLQQQTN